MNQKRSPTQVRSTSRPTASPASININGELFDRKSARVSVYDRGFLYGDSLYEVIRTYGTQFHLLDEHLARLQNSAGLCQMQFDQSLDEFKSAIELTRKHFYDTYFGVTAKDALPELYCRIIVTRGEGKIGFGRSAIFTPTQYIIIIQKLDIPSADQYQKGLSLKVSSRKRNDKSALDPAMKSGNYLNNLLAYLDAEKDGFEDALMCDATGYLTEGTTFNIFYVRREIIVTPPLDIGILDGITRRHVLELARKLNFAIREVRFPKERLYEADEVFITSTIKEVMAVSQVDQFQIGQRESGQIGLGKVTRALWEAYQTRIAPKERL